MIRFAGITEIFRLIFRQCSTTSPSWPSDALLTLDHPGIQWLKCPFRIWIIWGAWCAWTSTNGHLQWCGDDGVSHSITYLSLTYAVSTRLHEAWQRPLKGIINPWSPSPYRLQSRGGVKGLVGFLESCAASAGKTEQMDLQLSTRLVHHPLTILKTNE